METTAQYEQGSDHRSLGSEIARNPVVQTLIVTAAVSLAAWTGQQAGNIDPFVLQAPVLEPWWGPVVSVYAHSGPGHLVSNAILLVLSGGIISLSTSTVRFHAFFLLSGIISGVSFVLVTGYLGDPVGVLGASGATFALVGYLVTGNPASSSLLGRVSGIAVTVLAVAAALALTVYWSAPGSAYLVHFIGAVLGMIAGYFHLLRPTGGR